MEERSTTTQSNDSLIEKAAVKIALSLSEKYKVEFTITEIRNEIYGMKYGIISDNHSLYLQIKKEMEDNNINILYKETEPRPRTRILVNPMGNKPNNFARSAGKK